MVYFIACINKGEGRSIGEYEDYIRQVKPIVEQYGGRYKVRSNRITPLSGTWKPGRVIIIEWEDRKQLEQCFSSDEYRRIAGKRERSVNSSAIIVEAEA